MSMRRLAWEPINRTPLRLIEERIREYMKGKSGGVTLLGNGTLLFTPSGRDDEQDARRALQEARALVDFEVVELREGGYLVVFHHSVAVFVGEEEIDFVRSEVPLRQRELQFQGEEVSYVGTGNCASDHRMVGLYARGKLQRDAHDYRFIKRITI